MIVIALASASLTLLIILPLLPIVAGIVTATLSVLRDTTTPLIFSVRRSAATTACGAVPWASSMSSRGAPEAEAPQQMPRLLLRILT